MKDDQLTLRLPRDLARQLAKRAREQRVNKSHVVREALTAYLATTPPVDSRAAWERVRHLVGSARLDHDAIDADPLARQLYEHNWRD